MISSDANAQMKELVKLQKNARYRRKSGIFVAEGIKMIREAALYGRLQKVYLQETLWEKEYDSMEEKKLSSSFGGADTEIVKNSVFQKISETVTPQGILGLIQMPKYELEDILSQENGLYLLLDDLRDPGNLGTILRTSEGAGVSGVILSRESVDLFNPKVVRSTMGAIFRMPFVYVENLPDTIEKMKKKKISVYGTFMEGSSEYDKIHYIEKTGVVIGNEANGISKEVLQCLSGKIRIPMHGKLESLNAAVAAAVVLYEADRQRRSFSLQKKGNKI